MRRGLGHDGQNDVKVEQRAPQRHPHGELQGRLHYRVHHRGHRQRARGASQRDPDRQSHSDQALAHA